MHEVDCPSMPKVVVGYTKSKARTMEQVMKVKRFVEGSDFAKEIIKEIDELVRAGYRALKDGDIQTFGKLMNRDHELLSILGVNTPSLQRLVDVTRESSYGSKITGSGGGGSIIALSDEPQETASSIEEAGGVSFVLDAEMEGCKIGL
jgi:mevalonate kinase